METLPPQPPEAPRAPGARRGGLTRRGWAILGAVVLLVNLPLLHRLVRGEQDVTVQLPYQNDFSRLETLGADFWTMAGGLWTVEEGLL
ncbi:MAG TPA: hypothetical protein VFO83_02270, partial [Aggregicoccus sp.]|nr:hypothetical protein [Aggregicoccus sp.]